MLHADDLSAELSDVQSALTAELAKAQGLNGRLQALLPEAEKTHVEHSVGQVSRGVAPPDRGAVQPQGSADGAPRWPPVNALRAGRRHRRTGGQNRRAPGRSRDVSAGAQGGGHTPGERARDGPRDLYALQKADEGIQKGHENARTSNRRGLQGARLGLNRISATSSPSSRPTLRNSAQNSQRGRRSCRSPRFTIGKRHPRELEGGDAGQLRAEARIQTVDHAVALRSAGFQLIAHRYRLLHSFVNKSLFYVCSARKICRLMDSFWLPDLSGVGGN
jgi:hypothetical protein